LHARASRYFGEVPLSEVLFDPTRRAAIDASILDQFTAGSAESKKHMG
jgi:hypothetical protein